MRRCVPFVLCALLLVAPCVHAGEPDETAAVDTGKTPLLPEEARLIELGKPGPEHARLEPMIGAWRGDVRYWPYPGSAPIASEAEAERAWILGERWVRIEFTSTVGDAPFAGFALLGFDRVEGRYRSMWVDSLSTQTLSLSGRCAAPCRELSLSGERLDPQTGRTYAVRQVHRFASDGVHEVEYWDELDDGTMFKSLEIRWRRKGPGGGQGDG